MAVILVGQLRNFVIIWLNGKDSNNWLQLRMRVETLKNIDYFRRPRIHVIHLDTKMSSLFSIGTTTINMNMSIFLDDKLNQVKYKLPEHVLALKTFQKLENSRRK